MLGLTHRGVGGSRARKQLLRSHVYAEMLGSSPRELRTFRCTHPGVGWLRVPHFWLPGLHPLARVARHLNNRATIGDCLVRSVPNHSIAVSLRKREHSHGSLKEQEGHSRERPGTLSNSAERRPPSRRLGIVSKTHDQGYAIRSFPGSLRVSKTPTELCLTRKPDQNRYIFGDSCRKTKHKKG